MSRLEIVLAWLAIAGFGLAAMGFWKAAIYQERADFYRWLWEKSLFRLVDRKEKGEDAIDRAI
jgi:hypothetical protein